MSYLGGLNFVPKLSSGVKCREVKSRGLKCRGVKCREVKCPLPEKCNPRRSKLGCTFLFGSISKFKCTIPIEMNL